MFSGTLCATGGGGVSWRKNEKKIKMDGKDVEMNGWGSVEECGVCVR